MMTKKMTTDQMITMAQAALNQDLVKLEAQSDAALKVFMDTEDRLKAVNEKLSADIEKLEAMEQALAERRHQAEKLLLRNEATIKNIRSITEA